jgi:hypothetical protein
MLAMITRWKQSGQSQRAFCTVNNIAYPVFHYWCGVYRAKQNTNGPFLPLKVTTVVQQEQITISGTNGIELKFALTNHTIAFVKQLLQS